MKNLVYLLLGLTFMSCVDQGREDIERPYTLINKTNYNITIQPFSRLRENDFLTGDLTGESIKGNDIYLGKNSSKKIMRYRYDDETFYSIPFVDSVRVIFDNTKVLTYVCDKLVDGDCNSIFGTNGNFEHTITEQDYQDAEDCNGDCE